MRMWESLQHNKTFPKSENGTDALVEFCAGELAQNKSNPTTKIVGKLSGTKIENRRGKQ